MEESDRLRTEDRDTRKEAWEKSYSNRDNFVFYPHEEIIRFVSRYVRKRIGPHEFRDLHVLSRRPRLLDLGCGIGRHVIYGSDMGLDAYGVDLSETALAVAVRWAAEHGIDPDRFQQAHIGQLPWPEGFFDFVISHGVLDSMSFQSARQAIPEIARVLADDGLFYVDLVSPDDGRHPSGFDGEENVEEGLEQGTVQSYFTLDKINRLIQGWFVVLDGVHVRRTSIRSSDGNARFHLVLQKPSS